MSEQVAEEWHQAVGISHGLLSAACAVVTIGGLACFVTTVKMLPVGFFFLLAVILQTPNCKFLPNLVLMSFLGKRSCTPELR